MAAMPLAVLLVAGRAAAIEPAPDGSHFTDRMREEFLLQAKVIDTRPAPGGVTGSIVATLSRDGVVHDAHVQVIDKRKASQQLGGTTEIDFRDSWRNNVAAYRLDRLLGLGMVPVSVQRSYDGKLAAFTWWLDDVVMTEAQRQARKTPLPDVEAWNRQMLAVRLFDQLIYNTDRNLGNLLVDTRWHLWMIDHTRSFKIFGELKNPQALAAKCEEDLLAGLRRLDRGTLEATMRGLLGPGQIEGLLARRDRIVRFYDAQVAARGAPSVFYRLPLRGM